MPYTAYTQDSLATEILSALGDPAAVFWLKDEVYRTINEALLLWGAMTSYWRDRGTFSTAAATPFYDLSLLLLPTLRTRAYTMGQLATEIQYHLLESPTGTAGTSATDQFNVAQINTAIIRNRNELALDMRLPLTTGSFAIGTSGRAAIDESVALIGRASWLDGISGLYYPLRREDPFSAQSYQPQWTLNPMVPFGYSVAETPPTTIQLIPAPLAAGQFNTVHVPAIPLATADGTSLAFPDEFVWAAKYGALYDIFSTSAQGMDPLRAQYALERYNQAVEIAKLQRSILSVRLNNKPLPLDILQALDAARPRWQNQPGTPDSAWSAYDLLALSKIANGAFSMTCDVVRTAPLPTAPGDAIQIGREDIPYIFDYCRHVLSLKLGGEEFVATMPLFDSFLSGVKQQNTLLAQSVRYLTPLFSQPMKEQAVQPAA